MSFLQEMEYVVRLAMWVYLIVAAVSVFALTGRSSAELEVCAGGSPVWTPWGLVARVMSWRALRDDLADVAGVVERVRQQRGLDLVGDTRARLTALLTLLNFAAPEPRSQ